LAAFYSTGDIARILHQPRWRILRLFEDGNVPEPGRVASKRVIPGELLPAIVEALKTRGWMAARSKPPNGTFGERQPEAANPS
jgi:hypothetical protein